MAKKLPVICHILTFRIIDLRCFWANALAISCWEFRDKRNMREKQKQNPPLAERREKASDRSVTAHTM